MKYQPLDLGFMQQCGSSLLKALQNDSLPTLDLLVRECVQNSLDAALGDSPIQMNFSQRTLNSASIAGVLGNHQIAHELVKNYPGEHNVLEIRDKNTQGLTGPLSLGELEPGQPHGNLLKLVYEVGRSQLSETAGGSWGLGKTIYFRLGIGLVFYYTRIRTNDGRYAERFAACLVEDECSEQRIQKESQTGIGWWGAEGGGPLTDTNQIRNMLQALGSAPYSDGDTGTAIIVPFLRDDLLPDPFKQHELEDEAAAGHSFVPWWYYDQMDYLRVALQRWYSVRIDNPAYDQGSYLDVSVGGEKLKSSEMLTVFQLIQGLYNHIVNPDAPVSFSAEETRLAHIELRAAVADSLEVGTVAIAKLSKKDLQMDAPHNNPSPYWSLLGEESQPPFRPLIGFLRSPGMIVRWDDRGDINGWGGGFSGFADSYTIGIFVPHLRKRIHLKWRDLLGENATLESYLRSCEMADHLQWADRSDLTIIRRIRSKAGEEVRRFGEGPLESKRSSSPLQAARLLADRLLPRGFGMDGRLGPPSGGGRRPVEPTLGLSKRKVPGLEVTEVFYAARSMRMKCFLEWERHSKACGLRVLLDAEGKPIPHSTWSDNGGDFPIMITAFEINGLIGKGGQELSTEDCKVELSPDNVVISRPAQLLEDCCLEGQLFLQFRDQVGSMFQPVLVSLDQGGPQ